MEINNFLEHQQNDTLNVERVKALYKALKERDMDTISKLMVAEPVWNVCPGFPDGGIYSGMAEVFGGFYTNLRNRFHFFGAIPDVFVDGGDVVLVLGFYKFMLNEEEPSRLVRFAHTWGINPDGRIRGVWQVGDSAQFISNKADKALDIQSNCCD